MNPHSNQLRRLLSYTMDFCCSSFKKNSIIIETVIVFALCLIVIVLSLYLDCFILSRQNFRTIRETITSTDI